MHKIRNWTCPFVNLTMLLLIRIYGPHNRVGRSSAVMFLTVPVVGTQVRQYALVKKKKTTIKQD